MSGSRVEKQNSQNIANVQFIAQIDSSDCGAACLSMIAQYFKKDFILSEARHFCSNDVSGQRLSAVAAKAGLKADFVKKSFSGMMQLSMPAIAHWEGNHWVVLCGMKNGRVKIADPASGIYWLDQKEAERNYSDYCLSFSNDQDTVESTRKRNHVLLKCLVPFRRAIVASAFVMLLLIGIETFIPYSLQQVIDEELVAGEQSFQWLIAYSGLAAVIFIFGLAILSYLLHRGAVKSENLVLNALLTKWLNLPDNFYRGRSFAELKARMESAFEIRNFLVSAAGSGLFSLLEIIAVFAMLEYYGFALKFALMLLPSLILTFYTLYLAKENAGLFKYTKDSFLNKIDDYTRGIFSVRASSATDYFKKLQMDVKDDMYEKSYPVDRKILICEKGAQAMGVAAWILLFFQACKSYVGGDISRGVLFAVIILAALALNALSRIINKRGSFENAAVIYEYLNDVLDTAESRSEVKVLRDSGSLTITDKLGKSVSLNEGEKLLVRGTSASNITSHLSGKKESQFEVQLTVGEESYSSFQEMPQFSSIEDNAHIFNMSLMENVALGEEPDEHKVRLCLRLALADNVLERLTQGLKTKLNEGMLSHSEEKKILLARCLYRQRPIYLLENVSEFFTCRELLVFAYHLKVHLKDKTVIVRDACEELKSAFDKSILVIDDKILKSNERC